MTGLSIGKLAGAVALYCIAGTAQADFGHLAQGYANFNSGMNAIMNDRLLNERLQRLLVEEPEQADTLSPQLGSAAAASMTYGPSVARRKSNIARFVERSRRVDPQGAAAMERLFAGTDVFAAMDRELAPVRLSTRNVADAYAVWWMNAWNAAHGHSTTPDRATAQSVKAQAARALGSSPEFAGAGEAERQELAEALLVQAALIAASQEVYGRNPDMGAKLAAAVRQGARASGLDLDAMTLTEQGFVPAKRTGAAEPTPGARPEALAAAPADAQPGYGFLAAAGGAGLGAAFLLGKAMGRRG